MGHWDNLLVTLNLPGAKNHCCRHHPRGSVRRASGFVLTGKAEAVLCRSKFIWETGKALPFRRIAQIKSEVRPASAA
jgi:hypothetical protein